MDPYISRVCSTGYDYVASICSFYEKTTDIIEFLTALGSVIKEDWPKIAETKTRIYRNLFKTVIIDKFKVHYPPFSNIYQVQSLVGRDLQQIEQNLLQHLPNVSTAPLPLFEKRTGKFDALLGVGISSGLQE